MSRFVRASFALAAVFLGLASSAAASQSAIDTREDSNPTVIASFGNPNTATYGQLITATATDPILTGFTFRVEGLSSEVVFRAEVYAWNSATNRAIAPPLFEGKPQTTNGVGLQDIAVNTGAVPLSPGAEYVLLFTTSKDFEAGISAVGKFRATKDEAYSGGHFVFLNNGTNEKQLTETEWNSIAEDLQFQATFASTQQTLTVTKSGSGSGTVTSSTGGVSCGSVCSASLPFNANVALQAVPDSGSVFAGFQGGGCSSSPCLVQMSNDTAVTAVFVDVTPPQTTIVKRRGKKISFKSSEPNSTFTCTLDKKKPRKCTSPYKLPKLAAGRHVFKVYATDAAGNKDPTPAILKFTIG